jgi:hypothetical protein
MSRSEYFISESLKLARQLNLPDARAYLGGMLDLIGECEAANEIRRAFVLLDESDRQLELLATGKAASPVKGDGQ